MGHRVTNHKSKCRNLHGHRYVAEIYLQGNLVNIKGDSSEGMVLDFADVKKIIVEYVYNILDHGFMIWKKDKLLVNFFTENPDQKHIIVPFVPTCENIAVWIFIQIDKHIKDRYKTK